MQARPTTTRRAGHVDLTLPVEASAAPLRLAIVRTRADVRHGLDPGPDPADLGPAGWAANARWPVRSTRNATLAGTLAEPRINGRLDLQQGAFRDNATACAWRASPWPAGSTTPRP
jgi:translocation and assembly module TamB